MRPLQNAPFCPISASGSNFNPQNTQYIPPVKIFAFLDLGQISADFEIEHFSKVSTSCGLGDNDNITFFATYVDTEDFN